MHQTQRAPKKTGRQADRVDALAEALAGPGVLRLRDAARVLGVSEMTVRRDVAGVPDRFSYLGGYIVPRSPDGPYVMAREQTVHAAAKEAVGAAAAALVEDDDTIFIDCGTTMPSLVRHLPAHLSLTAVCYALNVAVPLSSLPNVRLILLGGLYHPSSASFAVEDGSAVLERLGINKAFISAGGVHAERGVSCSNFHEVAVKRAVLRTALHNCLVVDDSKLGKVKPAAFADLSAFDTLVTTEAPGLSAIAAACSGRLILA